MKALRFHETGDLGKLQIEEVAKPEAKEGEVLVQIRAASINPADIKNVLGLMKGRTTLPRIPGRDFAGIIMSGKRMGEEVFGSSPVGLDVDGVQAEYAVVSEECLIPKPKDISFEAASAIGIPYITAWVAIMESANIQPSDTVLITGAGGSVAQVAISLAKYKGAIVLGAAREAIQSDKIDVAIDLKNEDLYEACMKATDNKGVDVTLDTVGGELFEQTMRALANRGTHIVIASKEPKVSFNLIDFYRHQGKIIGIDTLQLSPKESRDSIMKILPLILEGLVPLPKINAISLQDAPLAYQKINSGELKGKIVISFVKK